MICSVEHGVAGGWVVWVVGRAARCIESGSEAAADEAKVLEHKGGSGDNNTATGVC